jgi:sphingomyelin phosphodiesterase
MFAHIADTQEIDSIFWTGDNSAHNVWSNSNQEVTDYTLLITNEIKAAFDSGIPVYPSTGNHDTWPVNVEDFSAPGINFPINHIVDAWSEWIGDEAAEEFAEWGYCSIPMKLAGGKVVANSRVLILNTQVANNLNWYLVGEKNDPANHI